MQDEIHFVAVQCRSELGVFVRKATTAVTVHWSEGSLVRISEWRYGVYI